MEVLEFLHILFAPSVELQAALLSMSGKRNESYETDLRPSASSRINWKIFVNIQQQAHMIIISSSNGQILKSSEIALKWHVRNH